jgi:hypothetical protein
MEMIMKHRGHEGGWDIHKIIKFFKEEKRSQVYP